MQGALCGKEHQLLHLLLLLLLRYINSYQSRTILKPHKTEDMQVSGGNPSEEICSVLRIFAINSQTDYFSGPFPPYTVPELLVILVP